MAIEGVFVQFASRRYVRQKSVPGYTYGLST